MQLGRPQPTTPDGAVLSGWWRRVVARVVDGIICGLVTVAVTYPWLTHAAGIMNGYFRDTFDAAANGGTAPPMPSGLASALLPISLASLAIYFVYEVVLLTLFATSPGRLLVGISVRLREQPGIPPLSAVLRRTVVKEGGGGSGCCRCWASSAACSRCWTPCGRSGTTAGRRCTTRSGRPTW